MDQKKLQGYFAQALENHHFSRGERQALRAVLDDLTPTPEQRLALVGRAFDALRDKLTHKSLTHERLAPEGGRDILDGLETLVKALFPPPIAQQAEVLFAPREDCVSRLRDLFYQAERSAEVCVFTITDNTIARSILQAHTRGITVKIITDDEKVFDRGSDIQRLRSEGIEVRTDDDADHMHHKFALFDRRLLVTGSYNWTRSAAERNRENLVLTDDRRLVEAFGQEFDRLWLEFAPDG